MTWPFWCNGSDVICRKHAHNGEDQRLKTAGHRNAPSFGSPPYIKGRHKMFPYRWIGNHRMLQSHCNPFWSSFLHILQCSEMKPSCRHFPPSSWLYTYFRAPHIRRSRLYLKCSKPYPWPFSRPSAPPPQYPLSCKMLAVTNHHTFPANTPCT